MPCRSCTRSVGRAFDAESPHVSRHVLQSFLMGNTLSIRLPKDLLERLRQVSRRTGLPVGRVVRQSLETTLSEEGNNVEPPWRKYAGVIKGGPPDVSSRKGFSRE